MTANTLLATDALRKAAGRLPGTALRGARDAALEQLIARGVPTVRDEDWKYTSLAPLVDIGNDWLANGTPIDDPAAVRDTVAKLAARHDAYWIVIANGEVNAAALVDANIAGVRASLLSESGVVPAFDAPLADLNIALLRDGLRIEVDPGVVLDKPLALLVIDSAMDADSVAQTNVDLVLAENSALEFVEYHTSVGGQRHYANTCVNVAIRDAARLAYLRVQDRDSGHSQTARLTVRLGRDSTLDHCAFDLGGRLVRNDLDIKLDAAGAHAAFHGLYLATDDQHIDNHTRVDHLVGPATSEQEYRGIIGGAARCVWNGKAVVHAGADGTDAKQANHNLLVSEQAEIDAKPELEIYADEVKCAHGTTVGQLDKNALFYLRTRGLDKPSARRLLTRAFAASVVAMAPVPGWRDALNEMVAAKLEKLTHGEDE